MKKQKRWIRGAFFALAVVVAAATLSSCSSRLGWGVLLWSTDDPFIPSGTVLPVYIRSNIDRVWVVGLPAGVRSRDGLDKMEIPIPHLELVGSRARAESRALEFAPFALTYAENLQVGLPIRAAPDNNAQRVYRLREGEVVKVLALSERGVPPLGVTGQPLPGGWYRLLAEDGTVGYGFSYRLRFFEHTGGALVVPTEFIAIDENPGASDLELLLSRAWVPESYLAMINSRRINLYDLSRRWHFDPGRDTNVAQIATSGVTRSFHYANIVPSGDRAWRFEGTSLLAHLRSDTSLMVQFTEEGSIRHLNFVSLPFDLEEVIDREQARRKTLHQEILSRGPVFTSSNFGTIAFGPDGSFAWRGFDLLVPQHISRDAHGGGTVSMDLFLAPALEDRYNGAFTMRFAGSGGRSASTMRAMYSIDSQGIRIEIVPESSVDGVTVARRSASPMVLFFFADHEIAGLTETDDLL